MVPNYQNGDPSLMGLSMVLTTQDPAELTGQLNSVQNVLDKESAVLARLEATKALLTVQEREVATAEDRVAGSAGRPRRTCSASRGWRRRPRRPRPGADLVGARRQAAHGRTRRAADLAELRKLQNERTGSPPSCSGARRGPARAAAAAAAAGRLQHDPGDGGPVAPTAS